ncbi:MAG: hypothetical protein NVS3B21_05740 [Acidimicrobiales bacterium]
MAEVRPPEHGDDWIGICADALPLQEASSWAVVPGCGGVVTFTGTVRDHGVGEDGAVRHGVTLLEYEAYERPAVERMEGLAADARSRWPELGRIVMLHRVGPLELCEAAVVVVVSAPHRGEAFDAARWAIDTLKERVPIWKKEAWAGGSDWGGDARPVQDGPPAVPPASPAASAPAVASAPAEVTVGRRAS